MGAFAPTVLGMSDIFIIRLQGAKKGSPKKQADFIRCDKHDCHIYQGKEFKLEQLNEVYPAVLEQYKDYEYLPPIPVIRKTRHFDMSKARQALKEKLESEQKGETLGKTITKKTASQKATRKKAAT